MAELTDIIVYATFAEAKACGARSRGGIWVAADGSRAITPASIYPVDGLRVTSYQATVGAIAHHNWPRLQATLERSILKTRPSS